MIISQALPKDIETFGFVDGVWVADPKVALPVAMSPAPNIDRSRLRAPSIRGAANQDGNGLRLSHRPALPSAGSSHRRSFLIHARRPRPREEKPLPANGPNAKNKSTGSCNATVGMYGDLQGIAGKTLQEIEGLEFQGMLDFKPDE